MPILYDSTADEIQFSGKPNYAEFDLLATSTDASVSFADGYQFKLTKDIRLLGVNAPGVLWSRNALNNKSWSSQQTLYIKVDGGEWQGVVFAAGTSYTPSTIATLINSSTNGVTATANVGTKGTYLSIKSDYDFTQSGADPADSWVEINSTQAVREYFGWEDYQRATGNAGCDLSDFGNVIINPNAKQIWVDDGVVDAKWRDVTFIETGPRLQATRKIFQGSDENSGNDNTRYVADGGGYCHAPEGSDSSGDYKTRIDIESVSNVRLWANEISEQEINEVLVRKSSELNGITAAPRVQSIGVDGRNAAGVGGNIRARFRDLKCSSALARNGTRLNAFWGASVMFEGLDNTALNPLATEIRWFNSFRGSANTTDQYVYFFGTAEAFARARGYTSSDIQNRVTYLHLIGGAIHYHQVTDGEGGEARYYDSRQTAAARHIPTLENALMLKTATVQEIGSDEQIQVVIHSWTVDTDSSPAWSRDDITGQKLVITKYEKNIISFDISDARTNIGRHDNYAPLPMTDDSSITEMTKSTVRGYSELDTAAKMYDWLKLILMNYFDEMGSGDSLYCTRTDTTINFGSRDVQLLNQPTTSINTIRSHSSGLQITLTGSRPVQVGDIIFIEGTTSQNGLHRVKSLTGTLAFETDGTFSANETGVGTVRIIFRPVVLSATTGTMLLHVGDEFAGSVESTGTITVGSGVSVTGTVKDSAGVSVLFSGLPAGFSGVVAAWPSSQGVTNRANAITGSVADDTATTIKLTLALNTSYHFVLDALGYRRSAVGTIDTTSQLQATAAVEQIVNATGQALIPTALTTGEQSEADLITWSAGFVDVAADEVGEVTPAVGATMTGSETENFDVDGLNIRVVSQTFNSDGTISSQTTNTLFSGNGRTAAQIVTSLNTSFNFANSGITASVSNGAVVLTRDDAGVGYGFYIHDNSTAASVLGFITGSANGVVGVDLIPAPRSPVDATPSFNSLSYEIERGQSTEAAQTSLLYPARIEQGRIIFPAMSSQKWRRKLGDIHVPDIEAVSIGKDGSADAGDFMDFSNGGLKYKTEPPVNIVLSGGSLLPQAEFNARMSGVTDSIKDTYKAADATISQSDFDALMLAVPSTTKDTYKGSGGGEGGTIDQTTFNTRMTDLPDSVKDTFKADVSAIPTDNPSASDIVDALEASTDGNGLTAIRSALTTVDTVVDGIKTVVDTLPTDNDLDQDDFDAKMLAVPSTTKDTYKGSGGGGGTSLTQTEFNTFMSDVPDATKDTYKADVSAIPTDNPSASDIVDALEASTDGNGLTAIRSALTTVDTVVDGIQTDLSNATDGLGALLTAISGISASISQSDFDALMLAVPGTTKDLFKGTGGGGGTSITQTAFNALMNDVPDATKNTYKADVSAIDTSGIATVDSNVDSIKSAIEDTTNGLTAIKTAIGNLNNLSSSDIASAVEGSATDTAVDSIKTAIDDTTNGLAAIVTAIGNLNNLASADVVSAVESSAVKTVVDAIKTLLENSTYGLAQIQTDISGIPTDAPPSATDITDAVYSKSLATGVDMTKALELIMAVLFGRASVSGNTVSFRNLANTVVCRVTVGSDGARTIFELVN